MSKEKIKKLEEVRKMAKELGMVPISLNWLPNKIEERLTGLTYETMEPLFEDVIIDLYLFSSQTPHKLPKYKIVNRETEEEYTVDKAIKNLKEKGILPK